MRKTVDNRLSSCEIFAIEADRTAFEAWNENDSEFDYSFAKKIIMTAIEEVLTEKQRRYFFMYHIEGLTIRKIAEIESVSPATVSKTLIRAAKKMHERLRWSNPRFFNSQPPTRNRRINHG